MVVKAARDESSPYTAMQMAGQIAEQAMTSGIISLEPTSRSGAQKLPAVPWHLEPVISPGEGWLQIGRIEDVTHPPRRNQALRRRGRAV